MKWLGQIFFALLILHGSVNAQSGPNPDTLWTRFYSGHYNSLARLTDSAFFCAGSRSDDSYLVKISLTGDSLWTRRYGGSATDYATEVQISPAGGLFIVGTTNSYGAGMTDIYVLRINDQGDTLWTRTLGGVSNDYGNSLVATEDGGCVLAGSVDYNTATSSCFIAKLNSVGDTLWTRRYGGSGYDGANSIVATPDLGYAVAGFSVVGGIRNSYLLKLNAMGDTLWTKTYDASIVNSANDVTHVSDGGYLMVGDIDNGGAPNYAIHLIKTDSAGVQQWERTFDWSGSSADFAYAAIQTADGGFAVCGRSGIQNVGGDFFLLKTNASGDSIWARIYVSSRTATEWALDVLQLVDASYLLVGSVSSSSTTLKTIFRTGPETPYHVTAKAAALGTSIVLNWVAPQTCDYFIYSTTVSSNDGNPPGPDWTLETTLNNLPAGPAIWSDLSPTATYKNYIVTMTCP
jgi:hypothetical protein